MSYLPKLLRGPSFFLKGGDANNALSADRAVWNLQSASVENPSRQERFLRVHTAQKRS